MIASETQEEQIRKIVRPLSHEKIIDILAEIGASIPGAFDKIYQAASMDVATRKIFVRGLGQATAVESLYAHFSQFGDVAEVNIIKDKATGQPKGYGFVTMSSIEAADNAVRDPAKIIDGRQVFCNLAAIRSNNTNGHVSAVGMQMERKIFVHGLGSELTEAMLREQFDKYGEVEEVNVVMDKQSNRSKGYGFVTFKDPTSVMRALEYPEKQINGKTLKCEMAGKPKQLSSPPRTGMEPGVLFASHALTQSPSLSQLPSSSAAPSLSSHTHPHTAVAHSHSHGDHSMFAYGNPAAGLPVHTQHGGVLSSHQHSPGGMLSHAPVNHGHSGAHAHPPDGWSSQRLYFAAPDTGI